jgi:Flp pilus assembly protein TadD/2-polyprenyl-3-methyl-5-hydroxy-6-metoxy-1,4-benzoquinol methylase
MSSLNQQRYLEAQTLALAMTKSFPRDRLGWMVLGMSFMQTGQNAEALAPMQKAAALSPGDADAHNILGIIFYELGRLDEAGASYRQALLVKPDYEVAHYNMGNTLRDMGRLDEAEASYLRALRIKPDYAVAHNNLGLTFHKMGRLDEAEASYRRALQLKPDLAGAHNNLGNILKDLGQLDDAEACFRRALEIKPDYVEALNNLASLLGARGAPAMALETISHSLQIEETEEAKGIFVACAKYLRLTSCDNDNRTMMTRALTELWGRPSELAGVCASIVKLDQNVGACVARAVGAWPLRLSAQDLFAGGPAELAGDTLLMALLNATPIYDIEMERFLTTARHALLEAAAGTPVPDGNADAALNFYCALAYQNFINEYVFAYTDEEICKANALRDSLAAALETGTRAPALWLAAVAAYFPLYALPHANRLLDFQWPGAIAAVLAQQVREPEEELQLRAGIPRLTGIENETSLLVQGQYEENPYPRWIRARPAEKTKNVAASLSERFPLAPLERRRKENNIDILIAGCGTGLHSIETAQQFTNAQVLAIDLSLSSLGYAKRKTQELGLTSIEYAQADLLKLGSLERSFDVIESVGVLHHLADPWAGWRVLLSLLRPGGFMKLGFYSGVARRNVAKVRNFIAAHGYVSTAEDIRRCRQDLLDLDDGANFGETLKSSDFFSVSTCRDLLFHVQEHCVTLAGIDDFLKGNDLAFVGFEMDANVLHAYKRRFPDDRAATNLGQWQVFEDENPDIFIGMYQFWIQKRG